MPDPAPARVLAVDDHPGYLEVIHEVVDATPGFDWTGGVSNGPECLAEVNRQHPDIVLVDVDLPGMDGLEVTRRLRRSHPAVLVALISAHRPDELPAAVAGTPGGKVLAKEDLRPAWLRELWRSHRR